MTMYTMIVWKSKVLDDIQEPIELNREENNIGLDMNENNSPNEKFVTPEKVSQVVSMHILQKKMLYKIKFWWWCWSHEISPQSQWDSISNLVTSHGTQFQSQYYTLDSRYNMHTYLFCQTVRTVPTSCYILHISLT